MNLVGNAVKFTHQGEIVVEVDHEQEPPQSPRLHFRVRDTGIGIAPEKQQQVFEAFTQADMSTTRQYGGTGLGLVICSTLVRLLGGQMWLDSAVEVGSTFHFTIAFEPAEVKSADGQPAICHDELAGTRRVDCGRQSQQSGDPAGDLLPLGIRGHRRGGSVRRFSRHLAQAANQRAFQLIVTDLNMPEMDGYAMVEQIRHVVATADTPIILLSSGSPEGGRDRAKSCRINRMLLKPVKQSALLKAVLSELRSRHPQRTRKSTRSRLRMRNECPALAHPRRRRRGGESAAGRRLADAVWVRNAMAHDGQEALECIEAKSFDLVLMDLRMPIVDGMEATRRIRQREQHTGRHLPIVAMTAQALKEDCARCLDAGMDGYLAKPVRKRELQQVLAQFSHRAGGDREVSPVRWEEVLESVGNDVDLLAKVLQATLTDARP